MRNWRPWLALFAVGLCRAQTPDPNALVRTALANYESRNSQAKDYAYLQHESLVEWGNVKTGRKFTTYEVLVINGRQYRVQLQDGKPMTPEEVERKTQELLSGARDWADEEVTRPVVGAVIVLPGGVPHLRLKDLPRFFDVHLHGQEVLEGRNTYVLEAKPKHGQRPSDEIESDPRTFKMKIWIDLADTQFVRVKAVAIHPGVLGYSPYVRINPNDYPDPKAAENTLYATPEKYSQGTTILMEWRKINGEVWLPSRVHIKGNDLDPIYLTPLQKAGTLDNGYRDWPFESDTVFDNYQKFNVTHRIVVPDSH